jgi:plasmid stabilization system protein ParE
MSYRHILLAKARNELLETWIWYEERQAGLGDRFKNEVYKRIHEIEQHPERYPERKKSYRETMIKTFPYLIIYRIDKKEKLVIVSSIFHGKRNPKKKYRK